MSLVITCVTDKLMFQSGLDQLLSRQARSTDILLVVGEHTVFNVSFNFSICDWLFVEIH